MRTLRYRGFGRREISSDDWSNVGVKSKAIEVNNGELIDVNDAAAEWLFEHESADWQELTDRDAEKYLAQQEKLQQQQAQEEGPPPPLPEG